MSSEKIKHRLNRFLFEEKFSNKGGTLFELIAELIQFIKRFQEFFQAYILRLYFSIYYIKEFFDVVDY